MPGTCTAVNDASDVTFEQRWACSPVFDIVNHSEAGIFVEDGEWDYDWRLMNVVAADFGIDTDAHRHLVLCGATHVEEEQRYAKLNAWADTHGGIVAATAAMPIIATIEDGAVHLLDGWHRLVLGATTAVVGRPRTP